MATKARPNTTDPLEWALYNEMASSNRYRIRPPLIVDLTPDQVPGPLDEFMAAVYRAVDDLEGQGARSDRVATQLLTALARLEAER